MGIKIPAHLYRAAESLVPDRADGGRLHLPNSCIFAGQDLGLWSSVPTSSISDRAAPNAGLPVRILAMDPW
ncbi:hypothetical protein POX_e06580 [Penicillium oxalicum]|nr:hypothetical protein POX_e06580 [Penicillium oxalicum]KAI2788561.1 hypothetical protein POX_e06580 [Penicillium oxalicum]